VSGPFGFTSDGATWTGTLPEGWDVVGGAINGGYLLAVATALAGQAVRQPDPVTVTGHFAGPGRPGPAEVEVTVHKAGRGHSTAGARLVQDGRTVLALLATFGDLGAVPDDDPTAVQMGDPATATLITKDRAPGAPGILDRLDLRIDPDLAGFTTGRPPGRAEMAGWVRPGPGTAMPSGALALLVFADVFPPPIFNVGRFGWSPTVELTVHCLRRPPEGWIRGVFRTRSVIGPYLEEDGELRDHRGRLLALSRQLALAPREP